MIVTTVERTTDSLDEKAQEIADKYNLIFVERMKRPVDKVQEDHHDDVYVVGHTKIELHPYNATKSLFFHPNFARVRIKGLMDGYSDPFIQAAGLKAGDSVLDCTMGLASDSITAGVVVGDNGHITALESNLSLYILVTEGLKSFESMNEQVDRSMKNIETVHTDHYSFLKDTPDNSYDFVYFDPMFEESIKESSALMQVKKLLNHDDLAQAGIEEAKRVARRKVVIKDYFRSDRFVKYGFKREVRKSNLFHYGVYDVSV